MRSREIFFYFVISNVTRSIVVLKFLIYNHSLQNLNKQVTFLANISTNSAETRLIADFDSILLVRIDFNLY